MKPTQIKHYASKVIEKAKAAGSTVDAARRVPPEMQRAVGETARDLDAVENAIEKSPERMRNDYEEIRRIRAKRAMEAQLEARYNMAVTKNKQGK